MLLLVTSGETLGTLLGLSSGHADHCVCWSARSAWPPSSGSWGPAPCPRVPPPPSARDTAVACAGASGKGPRVTDRGTGELNTVRLDRAGHQQVRPLQGGHPEACPLPTGCSRGLPFRDPLLGGRRGLLSSTCTALGRGSALKQVQSCSGSGHVNEIVF